MDSLPVEIRLQIFDYFLASSQHYVSLIEKDNNDWPLRHPKYRLNIIPSCVDGSNDLTLVNARLSLLLVCKRFYRDCNDVVWDRNELRSDRPTDLCSYLIWEPWTLRLRSRLRGVELKIDMFVMRKFSDLEKTFRVLVDWSKTGNLKKFTLVFTKRISRQNGHDDTFQEILGRWRGLPLWSGAQPPSFAECNKYMALLRSLSSSQNGFAEGVEKKMVLHTGLYTRSPTEKAKWLKCWRPYHPDWFAEELHHALGGTLYMDGELCYQEGWVIKDIFNLPTGP